MARLDGERYRPLAFDLRGHGDSRHLRPITFDACVRDVLDAVPEPFALAGYSLGGRVALHVALAASPGRVTRLALISTTAGIEDDRSRAARRAQDDALADTLEHEDIDVFAQRWSAGPLFADDPPAVRAAAAADIRRNDPDCLAAALRGIGSGAMDPLWARLPELGMPVAVMAGARDAQYVAIAKRLCAGLPAAELTVVEGSGHALPRESPGEVGDVLGSLRRRRGGR